MTLQPDDLRDAFDHAIAAADFDATAPAGLGQPTIDPVALGSRRSPASSRRRPALVAAAVVAVAGLGVGGVLVASERDRGSISSADNTDRRPIAGPVVAVGLDAPGLVLVDTNDETDLGPQEPTPAVPRSHLKILHSADDNVLVVADRAADGDGSLDRFPLEVPSLVDGVEVRSAVAPSMSDLSFGLRVSGWQIGDRHIAVATRGLTDDGHDTLVGEFVTASLDRTLRDYVPDGFTDSYVGPDENPFHWATAKSSAAYRDDEGRRVGVSRFPGPVDAEAFARYAWYLTDSAPTQVEGMPALVVDSDQEAKASLYLATPDAMVVLWGPTDRLARHAASVAPLDASGWADLRASATEPGSIYQSAEATDPP